MVKPSLVSDQDLVGNDSYRKSGRTLVAPPYSVQMDRVDSGFGELSSTPSEARAITMGGYATPRPTSQLSQSSPRQKPSPTSIFMWHWSASNVLLGNSLLKSNTTTVSKPTPRKKPRRNPSRHSSASQGLTHGSTLSSRRSSIATTQPSFSSDRRPSVSHRSIKMGCAPSQREGPLAIHTRSEEFFQSFRPSHLQISQNARRPLASPNLPALLSTCSRGIVDAQGCRNDLVDEPDPNPIIYENHVPATVIDWTFPSTRRLEYQRIDRSCQGFRGLWRRVAPRWFYRNGHLSFFDGNSSDAGSVRRYRLALPEDEKESKGERIDITEQEVEPSIGRMKWKRRLITNKGWLGKARGERCFSQGRKH